MSNRSRHSIETSAVDAGKTGQMRFIAFRHALTGNPSDTTLHVYYLTLLLRRDISKTLVEQVSQNHDNHCCEMKL